MLTVINLYRELNVCKLMEIYTQSNAENAEIFFPREEPGIALTMAEQEFCRYLREDFFKISGAFYAVWTIGELWVSALRMEPYGDGFLLEALETHPDYRRRGYATTLIRAVQKQMASPYKLYSHVSKNNSASLSVHKACGFRQVLDHAVYVDGSVSYNAITLCYKSMA